MAWKCGTGVKVRQLDGQLRRRTRRDTGDNLECSPESGSSADQPTLRDQSTPKRGVRDPQTLAAAAYTGAVIAAGRQDASVEGLGGGDHFGAESG